MPYMQIGAVVVEVLTDSADDGEPGEVAGVDVRTHAFNLRSTRRAEKLQWRRQTRKMTIAQVNTLLAVIGAPLGGNFVSCTGNFSDNVAKTCQVTVIGRRDHKDTATTIKRSLTLLLREV